VDEKALTEEINAWTYIW